MTLVIGVDPGTYRMGVGVIRVVGKRLKFVRAELLEAEKKRPLAWRLQSLREDLVELCNDLADLRNGILVDFGPADGLPPNVHLTGIEEGFGGGFASDLSLAEVRGVAREVLASSFGSAVLRGYAPATVKLAATGRGNASKEYVAKMVTARLKLKVAPGPDVADALAVAITRAMEVT